MKLQRKFIGGICPLRNVVCRHPACDLYGGTCDLSRPATFRTVTYKVPKTSKNSKRKGRSES